MVRPYKKSRYFLAAFITLAIFLLGVAIGSEVSDVKVSELEKSQEQLRTDLSTLDLQYTLLEENICEFTDTEDVNAQLYTLSARLTTMEDELGKNDPDVLRLVEFYDVLQLRHWNFLKKQKEKCGMNYDLVLFFFSNEEGVCQECEEQGFMLTYLHKKDPNFISYGLNVDIDNPVLNLIKKKYNVTTTPTMIINEQKVEGFTPVEEIQEYINKSS